MVRRRPRSTLLPALALLAAALSGCATSDTPHIDSPIPLTSAPVTTGPVPALKPVSIPIRVTGGDGAASLVITLGVPAPMSTLQSEPAVQACAEPLRRIDAVAATTLAMPVSLALTVTAGTATTAGVDLSRLGMLVGGTVNDPAGKLLWAKAYGNKPACGTDTGTVLNPGAVEFAGVTRGAVNTFRAWILLADVITAADPTGTAGLFSALVIQPTATLNATTTTLTYASASAIVRCTRQGSTGTSLYVPLARSGALSRGCSA